MIAKVIGGHFGLAPKLGRYIAENKCEAYNFPLGVMTALYRVAVQNRKGELSKVGLGTFCDPRLEGGKLNSVTTEDIIRVENFDGEEWLYYPVPEFNVALIRGTTGDEDGNITVDHEVSKFELRDIAMAVHAHGGKVIAQVKDVAAKGTLTADRIEIPGTFVDAVVVAEDSVNEHKQTKAGYYDSSMSGHINIPIGSIKPLKLDARKVIARRCAMELVPNAVVNLGIGVPEGVSVVASEEGSVEGIVASVEGSVEGCVIWVEGSVGPGI
jgi:propionate CoA-transferase